MNALVNSVLDEISGASDDPFLIYRNKNGEWELQYAQTESGGTADLVKGAMETDPLAVQWSAGDFGITDFHGIYDSILLGRVMAEYSDACSPGNDSDKLKALTSLVHNKFGDFSHRTKEYLSTLDRPLSELAQICPFDMTPQKGDFGHNRGLAREAVEYIEHAVLDRLIEAKKAPPAKRVIEGYAETLCIPFGGRETVLAENQGKEQPYLVCSVKWDNPFGAEERYDGVVTDDYAEAMREVVKRVDALVTGIETDRMKSGLPIQRLTAGHCLPDSMGADWVGKVAVVRPESLAPEYRSAEHQLILCTGGNGANPNARGQAVFAEELFTGNKMKYERRQIAGLADPVKLPEWAAAKLAALGQGREAAGTDAPASPGKKPSLLGRLGDNKEKVERGKEANGGREKPKKRRETEVTDFK